MNKLINTVCLIIIALASSVYSSQAQTLKWFNPAKSETPCIQQRGFAEEMKGQYGRFPERAKGVINENVWNLSRNSAGLALYFYTNAPSITVKYTVSGGLNMAHMPSTGVSGIDMYTINRDGKWFEAGHKYSFGDTITYVYSGLDTTLQREYRLYFPLYNSVTWMEIGVPEESFFEVEPIRHEKPIVVYGTSIAQGGCASRPGNAWTNVLARNLDWPVMNFGFSGNGKLEPEVIQFINEIDGAAYLLDCYPNLGLNFTVEEKEKRTIDAVRAIRAKHDAPIIIVMHTGFNQNENQIKTKGETDEANIAAQSAYNKLKDEIKDLYLLTFDESVRSLQTTVEGIHPNDYGMIVLASKHEALLRQILNMPIGDKNTTIPVTQRREPYLYGWQERHQEILRQNIEEAPKRVILGNSITHYWGGAHRQQNGKTTWKNIMEPAGYRNMGCGWDYVQNVLWRVYHGEIDGFDAEKVILNIGTNNLMLDPDEDIVEGIVFLLDAIKKRQPKAKIKVVAIYPRRNDEKRVEEINKKIKEAIVPLGFEYCDVGNKLLKADGKIDESLFLDGLHPNEEGYSKIAKEVAK